MNPLIKRFGRPLVTKVGTRASLNNSNKAFQQLSIRFNSTSTDGEKPASKDEKKVTESKTETETGAGVDNTAAAASAASVEAKIDEEVPQQHQHGRFDGPSSAAPGGDAGALKKFDADEYDDWEPKTAKEKVSYYSQIAFTLGLLGLGSACVYVFIKEVNPFGRSPQSIFDHAVDRLIIKDEIKEITGPSPRAYGRDHGSQSEGRRNIVDSRVYKERDGSQRTRVRFNIKGTKGRVMVWAEVSDKMASNEYVYLICQDMRTKRVITVEDNRARLETEMEVASMGSGNGGGGGGVLEEQKAAMMKLLGGGK